MFGIKFVGFLAFVTSLLHTFDNHIQNISYRISADISDMGIFLLPNIGIGSKSPISAIIPKTFSALEDNASSLVVL